MIIIGCDPDSAGSGFAFFIDGVLKELKLMDLIDFYNTCQKINDSDHDIVELHIEDVKSVKGVFQQRVAGKSKPASMMVAQNVGMCKQVQTEVERIAEHFGIKIVRHKVSKMWKKDKAQFEKVTGWTGRSNEDTRSAAWFGYLGVTMKR